MHGFTTDGYRALGGAEPWLHARGNIFSGNAAAIEAGTGAYERSLEQSLARGFMGTEESALTLAIMRFPALFHVNLFLFHFTCGCDFCALADANHQQRVWGCRTTLPNVSHAVSLP